MQLLEFQANTNPVQFLSRKFPDMLGTTVRLLNFPVANYKSHEVRLPLCGTDASRYSVVERCFLELNSHFITAHSLNLHDIKIK